MLSKSLKRSDVTLPGVIKKPRKNYRSEYAIQIEIAGFLRKWLAPPAWFTAFPAGGGGFHRGQMLWQMGLKAGVPDLLIMWGAAHWIELKNDIGHLKDNQIECHAKLRAAGAKVGCCRTLDQVKAQIAEWGIPLLTIPINDGLFAHAMESVMNKGIDPFDDSELFPESDDIGSFALLEK
jgi:hypothetical protein